MGKAKGTDPALAWCERAAEACVRTVLEEGAASEPHAIAAIVHVGIAGDRLATAGCLRSVIRPGHGPTADALVDDCALGVLASLLGIYTPEAIRLAVDVLGDEEPIESARLWLESGRIAKDGGRHGG